MSLTDKQPICRLCGQVLGVYEPVAISDNGVTKSTSIAAELSVGRELSPPSLAHLGCHSAERERQPSPSGLRY